MVDERAQTEAREEKEKEKVGLGPLSRGIYIVLSYLTIVLSHSWAGVTIQHQLEQSCSAPAKVESCSVVCVKR